MYDGFFKTALRIAYSATLVMLPLRSFAATDIKLDNQTSNVGAINLSPDSNNQVHITDTEHGKLNGNNLLFSFEKFSIGSSDTALFQCSGNCSAVTNVISRVTGSLISSIDGKLQSTINHANFWLFNPNGVAIGNGAQIDVPAGFYVGNADRVNFNDGQSFGITTDLTSSSLELATPEAFGFGSSPGDISISGSSITLNAVGPVQIASGKDIVLDNSQITSNGTGKVELSAQENVAVKSNLTLNVSGPVDVISNKNVTLENSQITSGPGKLDITAKQDLLIKNTATFTPGSTGDISLSADRNLKIGDTAPGSLLKTGTGNGSFTVKATGLVNGGQLSFQGTGSKIADQSSGSGAMVVTVGNGDLKLQNSSVIEKINGSGPLAVTVDNGSINIVDTGSRIASNTANSNNIIQAQNGITNHGILTAARISSGAAISNTYQLNGNAIAATDLNNSGHITGDADVTSGSLVNNSTGTIDGKAMASLNITNHQGGQIQNGAEAGDDIINAGIIAGPVINAGQNIDNNTATAEINLTGASGEIMAGNSILIGNGGRISTHNTASTLINAANNLTLDGTGSQLTVAGNAIATLSAGNQLQIDNGAKLSATNTAPTTISAVNNLTVGNRGVGTIEKSGSGSFWLKTTGNSGDFTVKNLGSGINAIHTGDMQLAAGNDLLIDNHALVSAGNTGNATLTAGRDIKITTAGQVALVNTGGDAALQAGITVDSGIPSNTGGSLILDSTGKLTKTTSGNTLFAATKGSNPNSGSIQVDGSIGKTGTDRINTSGTTQAVFIADQLNATGTITNADNISADSITASGDLLNSGIISTRTVNAANLIHSGSAAQFHLTGADGKLAITQNLQISNGAKLNTGNSLSTEISAAQLSVTGNNSQLEVANNAAATVTGTTDLLVDNGGVITVSGTGPATISAANLKIGNAGTGIIEKTGSGSGLFDIKTTGNTGNLSLQNSGSQIVDQSTGSGAMNVNVVNGDLTLGNGVAINKTGGNGTFKVTVAGALSTDSSSQISKSGNNPDDLIQAQGNIINNGRLQAYSVSSRAGTVQNAASGIITGNTKAALGLINNNQINGAAETTAGDLLNTNTITGTAISTVGTITNPAGASIGGGASAGLDIDNQGQINGGIIQAGRDILNNAATSRLTLTQADGTITAGRDIVVSNGARISATNTHTTTLDAARNLTVTGSNSEVALASAADVNLTAGNDLLINNSGKISAANTGATLINVGKDMTVGGSNSVGTLQKTGSTGTFKVGIAGQLNLPNSNSAISSMTHQADGGIQAGGAIINNGRITVPNLSSTAGTLDNTGTITAKTDIYGDLTNQGPINGEVLVRQGRADNTSTITGTLQTLLGDIDNSGRVNGSVISGKALDNRGRITDAAGAGTVLTNSATIDGNATAARQLVNNGTIQGNATVTSGSLINNRLINGDATAASNLINNATINGSARTLNGDLQNSGVIGQNAAAGAALVNRGTMKGSASAVSQLDNYRTIEKAVTVSDGELINHADALIKQDIQVKRLSNAGNIQGNAAALDNLENTTQGHIYGRASAGQDLINRGLIDGGAATTHGELNNTNIISGPATAGGRLVNSGTITGAATAGTGLENTGRLESSATVTAGTLINQQSGYIKGDTAGFSGLTNDGTIDGNAATTEGDLTNNRTIAGNATAGGSLTNTGTITGRATAATQLDNSGTLENGAEVTGGSLLNRPSGYIKQGAVAYNSLTNNGIIDGNVGTATGDVRNNRLINGDVTAGQNLFNTGRISNAQYLTAGLDLINRGPNALIHLNRNGGQVRAYRDVYLDNKSKITAGNKADAYVISGYTPDFQPEGNPVANAPVIINETPNKTGYGGNIWIQGGGQVEKTTPGNLYLIARNLGGPKGSAQANAGKIIVKGANSKVSVSKAGSLIVKAQAPAELPAKPANSKAMPDPGSYALQISEGGKISADGGAVAVSAPTVFLNGTNAVSGNQAISFSSEVAKNQARPAFQMQSASILQNTGGNNQVTLTDYTLAMDNVSGIKSNTKINLAVSNKGNFVFPKVETGLGAMEVGLARGKSYLDAPEVRVNKSIQLNPEKNSATLTRDLSASAIASGAAMPHLPESPCHHQEQSSLNAKVSANYQPQLGAQVPFSVLTAITRDQPAAVRAGHNLAAETGTAHSEPCE